MSNMLFMAIGVVKFSREVYKITGPIIRTALISGGLYCSFSLLHYSSYYTYTVVLTDYRFYSPKLWFFSEAITKKSKTNFLVSASGKKKFLTIE